VTPVATRFRFFGGKGGVGKTTCAAAAALALAETGRHVLLVSTDPAHSLGDALARPLSARPRRLPARRGRLMAVELDADRALERWVNARRRPLRTLAERGTYLDEDDVERFLQLSLPGVDEMVGLLELNRLAAAGRYDDVVVDTAPTGHTLRLLAIPDTLRRIAGVLGDMHAKHRFLAGSFGAPYRPDAADALVDELDAEGRALGELLRDGDRCRFLWLLLPEALALEEARDGVRALDAAGITVSEIVVNGVTRAADPACPVCGARARAEQATLRSVATAFAGRPVRVVAARTPEPRGLAALRAVGRELRGLHARPAALRLPAARGRRRVAAPARDDGLRVVADPALRLLAFAGKGGVGKTTCAAAAALALAERAPDRRVLVLSTDPAHSLGDVLGVPLDDEERPVPGAAPGLRAREMDADRAFARERERYRAGVETLFGTLLRGSRLEVAFDREVIEQLIDLAPPGLDELFAVLSVIDALFRDTPAPYDVVVLDMAPTGHALRLLRMPAAALEWVHALLAILLKYRSVVGLGDLAADLMATARSLRALIALLHDPHRARVLAVTRPAELPRLETTRLLRELRRLEVATAGLVVNAVTPPGCARCRAAAARERRLVARLRRAVSASRTACAMILAPAVFPPPRGAEALRQWIRTWECDG
jgi:arsenite-transporting ATPase